MNTRQVVTDVLRSQLSIYNTKLDPDQYRAVEMAMVEFGGRTVDNFEREQNKAAVKEALRLFPALFKGQIMLYLRKKSLNKAVKQAELRAEVENRKMYVIRASNIAYTILSTADIEHNKKIRVFGKDVDAIKLHETADRVVYPPNRR